MKKWLEKQNTGQSVAAWLSLQTLVIIIASICSFLLVELLANLVFGPRENGNVLLLAVAMAVPMAVLLGGLNYFLSNTTYRHIKVLAGAMQKVAGGNFGVRLKTTSAGPLSGLYENFNAMCEELEHVQELRGDFANNYSHEFKTPIVSIHGFADLLLETKVGSLEQREYLEIIRKESANLADLANSTILLSKLDSHVILTGKEPYALDEQLRYCAILLAKRWSSKSIDFSGELEAVTYTGNADLMRHVWLNLMGNAVKFTPGGGRITTQLKQENGNIVVRISDTGQGMKQEETQHIFEKYYQTDQSHTKQGLGIGLSIVQRIVALCGGNIAVESQVGVGSSFVVTLPQPPAQGQAGSR